MLDQYSSPIMTSIAVSPHMFDPYSEKVNPGHLYVRDAIQIIQLVEASPPPRRISSDIEEPVVRTDDTYDVRMKRIQNWRDNSIKAMTLSSQPRSLSLKRKLNQNQTDDDVSHTPKRSRSRDPHSVSRLFGHSCTACDTPFSSRQSLRQHGRTPHISEACG
ncbi:hypothetical protein BDR07DRAFT_1416143 [Suillus spraguei]|nr:hypothetical protein BDR07DRAFT_1416143 [Suillus spraguei]